MSRLNKEIKNMKHNLILQKASEMFEQYGYEEMKVSLLAKEVGVSVGTIYAYFDSKEGLYSAFMQSEIDAAYLILEKLFAEEITFEEKLLGSIEIKFKVMSQKRQTLKSGILNNPFFFESQQILHREGFEKIYALYLEPIEKMKEVEIETLQLIQILNAMGNAYVMRWIEGEIEDLESKAPEVCDLFLKLLKGCP